MEERWRLALAAGERAGARHSLAVPRAALRGIVGAQFGRNAGSSVDFKEHRLYHPGDDPRSVDWGAYARSDRLHVKMFHEEVSPHLDLLVDGSASMAPPTSVKADTAAALAAALAVAAGNSGFTHAAWLARGGCEPVPGGNGEPAVWRGIGFDGTATLEEALGRMPPRWRGGSIRILVGDLLFPGDPAATLRRLAHGAAAVAIVQVLAKSDTEAGERGGASVFDCETGEIVEVFVDAGVESRYRGLFDSHQRQWRAAATQAGARMVTIIVDDGDPAGTTIDFTPLVTAGIMA